jgi:hypothetical protein
MLWKKNESMNEGINEGIDERIDEGTLPPPSSYLKLSRTSIFDQHA